MSTAVKIRVDLPIKNIGQKSKDTEADSRSLETIREDQRKKLRERTNREKLHRGLKRYRKSLTSSDS